MTDSHGVARDQLKSIVQRVERIEGEITDLNADKSEIYKEARANGFDVKAIKKVVQQRKLDTNVREEADLVFDTYWSAIHGPSLVHTHARENIEEFDAETGEVRDTKSPRKAAEAVSERTAMNPVANVGEEAIGAIAAASSDPASRADEGGERQHSSTVGFTGDCRTEGKEQSDASAASEGDAAADAYGIPATTSSADERKSPDDGMSGEGANTGGDHVAEPQRAATHQAGGLVKAPPANFTLRPNCRNPGPTCGGHGSNHCHACKMAARELETA